MLFDRYLAPDRTNNNSADDAAGHEIFQVLGEGKRPDHTWAIVDGSHTRSVIRIDTY